MRSERFGVHLYGSTSGNTIGGTEPEDGNLIGFYQQARVTIGETLTDLSIANIVLGNRYRGGSGPPIDLASIGDVELGESVRAKPHAELPDDRLGGDQ